MKITAIKLYNRTRTEAVAAYQDWGMNCGPAALAAILDKPFNHVREAVESVGFAEKKYMSPTMMRKAIRLVGGEIVGEQNPLALKNANSNKVTFPLCGLARIQWCGPWTDNVGRVKWAYKHTHWVAACRLLGDLKGDLVIFDVNGGARLYDDWKVRVVPTILAECVPRNNGEWYLTHSWEIEVV